MALGPLINFGTTILHNDWLFVEWFSEKMNLPGFCGRCKINVCFELRELGKRIQVFPEGINDYQKNDRNFGVGLNQFVDWV
jgi:hypothetical protein